AGGDLGAGRIVGAKAQREIAQRDRRAGRRRAQRRDADLRAGLDGEAARRRRILDADRERDVDRLRRADAAGRERDAAEHVAGRRWLLVPAHLAAANLDALDVEVFRERLRRRLALRALGGRAEILPVAAAVRAAQQIETHAVDPHAADLEAPLE